MGIHIILPATSSPLRFGVAAVSVMFGLVLTLLLWPWMEPNRFLLLFVAVIFSSWWGRLGPGLFAAVLAILSDLLVLPSAFPSAVSVDNVLRLGLLILVSLLVGSLSASRKKVQEERDALLIREQAARLGAERANRSKDEFLAAVSHDLRTPLTSLLMWVRMLSSGKLDQSTYSEALDTVASNVKSLAQLLDDLLDVSRIVSGKLRIKTRPMALGPVVQAATDVTRHSAKAKGITVETVSDSSSIAVLGDPDRLQQVIWNLLSNAIKFSPSSALIELRLECTDKLAHIIVKDSGCGIDAEDLPHVFERSFQANEQSGQHGLGLGLTIAQHIVQIHRGTITVESPGKGKGTSFTVQLPLLKSQELQTDFRPRAENDALERAIHDSAQPLEALRILVVDDEVDSREVVAMNLRMYGARVTEAASSAEAVAAIMETDFEDQPHVIVSDIMMPSEDGYGLIRKIRTLDFEHGGQIPAVALTAHAKAEDRIRALEAGFQEHLPKPVEPAELVAVLVRLTGPISETAHPTTRSLSGRA